MSGLYLVVLISTILFLPWRPAGSKPTQPEQRPFDIPPGLIDKPDRKPRPMPGVAVPEPLTIYGGVLAAALGFIFKHRKDK